MRAVPLLIILVCGLTILAVPKMSVANPDMAAASEPAPAIAVSAADEADYQALQSEADFALALLTQAQGRRLAMAQFAGN